MVKPGWNPMQVVERRESTAYPNMPIVGQLPFRRTIRSVGMWKPELLKRAPVAFLVCMTLLFAGVFGRRVIAEMDNERALRMEISGRLLGITTSHD
jgi:hypothetical protein